MVEESRTDIDIITVKWGKDGKDEVASAELATTRMTGKIYRTAILMSAKK